MSLPRRDRIIFELFWPPLIGGLILGPASTLYQFRSLLIEGKLRELLSSMTLFTIYAIVAAYLIAAIPSILYTCIMEWRFARGLNPRSWYSVTLSTFLGFASGASIAFAYGLGRSDLQLVWISFGGTGLTVGFIMGLLIKIQSKETKSS